MYVATTNVLSTSTGNNTFSAANVLERNSTPLVANSTRSIIPVHQADWIIPITINILLIFLTVWVLISLLHYGIKTGKWNPTQKSNVEKLSAGLIYASVVLCTVSCLLRYIFVFPYFSIGYGHDEDRLCDIFSDMTSITYCLVLFSTALFWWSRQRIFYANRMLNVCYSTAVRFFSKFSLGVILICGLAVLIFTVLPNDHPSTPHGCIYKTSEKSLRTVYLIAIVLTIAGGQVTIICLFVHAIRATSSAVALQTQHRIAKSSSDSQTSFEDSFRGTMSSKLSFDRGISRRHVCSTIRKRKVDPVKGVLRITLLFAIISLLTDVFIQMFSFYFESAGSRRILATLLSANAFLNLLLVVFSFKNYKKMLFSWFYK